jgi:hypothetical protein
MIFNLYERVRTKYNEPTWLLYKRIICIFFPKKTFSYEWTLKQFFLQLIIVNVYSCRRTWHVFFFIIFENIWKFENIPIPCKLNISAFKMTIISNHNQFLFFLHFYVFLYNKLQKIEDIMYILPHLCVAKDFWNSKILD